MIFHPLHLQDYLSLIITALEGFRVWGFIMIKVWTSVNRFVAYLSGSIIVILMLIIVSSVFMRYFFKQPLEWVDQFSNYFLVWSTFLAVAWVLIKEGHVSVDILYASISAKKQTIFKLATNLMGFVYCLIFTYIGFGVSLDCYQRGLVFIGLDFDIPQWPIMFSLPVGGLLMTIEFGLSVFKSLNKILYRQ